MVANLDNNEIILRIRNELVMDEALGQSSNIQGGEMLAGGKGGARRIKARTLLAGGVQLLGAAGQTEMASAIGTAGRYATLAPRIASGDPTAIANLAFDLASQAITAFRKMQEEQKREKIEKQISLETTRRRGQVFEHAQRYHYGI